ncbi:MAG: DUF4249 family protein [Bacteroidetes bacterium]|nr:DUF4249 family protein [Bacteroidota bacterium]
MLKKFGPLAFLALPLLWSSCETDFSLNGDYEITPVVFGLLDHTKDVHIIKITKAYMGDGDNLVYAQEADSNYFTSVDAQVIEYKDGAETGRSWQLHDSIITNKDTSGIFYAPEQKVYVFYANDLDSSAEYELVADLNEGAHTINSRTSLIKGFALSNSVYMLGEIAFAANTVVDAQDYKIWAFTVYEGLHGMRYSYKYTMRWTEYYADNSTQSFSQTRNDGDVYQSNPDQPSAQTASFGGLDFYQWVAAVVPDDPNVVKRKLDGIDLRVTVAHEELDQYLDVTTPVTSIAQVQPEYTNINGGLGLFSSRVVLDVAGFDLNKASRKELCHGQYTGTKLFCSSNPADVAESYYCP